MKRIILLLIFSIFLISFTSATVSEVNNFKYAIINTDGSVSYTSTSVSNVNALGFVCSDSSCSGISGNLWDGSTINSGSSSQSTFTYPTSLQSSYGYGVFVYKNGYIPFERGEITYYGSGDASEFTDYLAKKQSCTSNINSFSVSSTAGILNVGVNVQSPLQHAGPISYVPSALTTYYSTVIDVTLEVWDSTNILVYTNTQQVTPTYSDDATASFSIGLAPGTYNVKTYTTLDNEAKCLAYDSDTEQQNINVPFPDSDGDGYASNVDCDDNSVSVWMILTGYVDGDGDGYGAGTLQNVCSGTSLVSGYVSNNVDCDDNNLLVNPGILEVCDGVDNNCNGFIDESCGVDNDGDSYDSGVDCDDNNALINPGALEVLDGVDNNCNGFVDEGFGIDNDGDGYDSGVDCNDNNALINPGVAEVCDGVDNNCDGVVDEGCSTIPICGNFAVEVGEQCDDGNLINGDGCSSLCLVEGSGSSSSSSGGGTSSSSSNKCTPEWRCSEWSECINSAKTRTCEDMDFCGDSSSKPFEVVKCQGEGFTGLSFIDLGTSSKGLISGNVSERLPWYLGIGIVVILVIVILVSLLRRI